MVRAVGLEPTLNLLILQAIFVLVSLVGLEPTL